MRSPNLSIGKHRHLNLTIRMSPDTPIFLLPTFFLIPSHDVNLEIEGFAIGFCLFRTTVQVNIRKSSWPKKNASVDLVRGNTLAAKMQELYGPGPDAMALVNTFEKNRWLRELTSRGVEETHYGLKIIREMAKDSGARKQDAIQKVNTDTELNIDGLD